MQGHANTEAGLDRLRPGLHQLGAGLALLPVTQLAIDARECVLVFAALRRFTRGFELVDPALDLPQATRGHEISVRADGTLRHVLGDFGPVVLAYECPAHGPSIALQLRRRHRQLSGSKLTTAPLPLVGQAL